MTDLDKLEPIIKIIKCNVEGRERGGRGREEEEGGDKEEYS